MRKAPERFTIDDLVRGAEGPRDWRRFPRLVGTSFRLAWRAGPRELLVAGGLQVFNGVATFVQLLIGREVLQALLGSTGASGGRYSELFTLQAAAYQDAET